MQKERIFTKNFVTVSIINASVSLGVFLLFVVIAPYAVEELNASLSVSGLMVGIFVIGVLFGRLLTGKYINIVGNKKSLVIGVLLIILTTSFYFFTWNLYILFFTRFIHGFTIGITTTATSTIVALIIPPTRRGEGIGYYSLSIILATAIGPLIGVLLMQLFDNYNYIFIFILFLAMISLILALLVNIKDTEIKKEAIKSDSKVSFIKSFIEPKVIPVAIIAMLVSFSYSSIMSFIIMYTETINLVEIGSLFYVFYAAIIILSRPFTGRLMDQRGENIIIYPSLIIFALGMVVYSQANHSIFIVIAAILIGLGFGNFNSISQAVALKSTTPERFGMATATYFAFFDFGLGVGPFIIGHFVSVIGFRSIYLAMAGITMLAFILYYLMHRKV